MEDIDIARQAKLQNIAKVAEKLGIEENYLEQYGKYKAKISNELYEKLKDKKDGKLILVTSINPTPLGEGKTTISIGLADGLSKINKKAILALREPSLGPVFGIKGGATGGGYVQVAPMEEINLHFTGDIHAITSANNLLSALIDNHIFQGNELGFDKVIWKRCVDLNDRALRKVEICLSGEKNAVPREDGFDITVASEIMAIFCLAEDINDLKRRIGNIVVGYNKNGEEIRAKDLKAEGAMTVLLKDAIEYANSVVYKKAQSKENLRGMGTTLDVCLIYNSRIYIGHVGDSRVYRIRKEFMRRLTKDHSYVQTLVDDGTITKEEAYSHPKKNMLTKALGCVETVEPDVYTKTFIKDDIILMCSDGLTNMIREENIYEIIKQDKENAIENLVKQANDNGGLDNITVVIIM